MCNGHADTCDIRDPKQPKKLECICQHNTYGPQCASCLPGFQQKKWQISTAFKKFTCERAYTLISCHLAILFSLCSKSFCIHKKKKKKFLSPVFDGNFQSRFEFNICRKKYKNNFLPEG